MIIVSQIRLPLTEAKNEAIKKAVKKAKLNNSNIISADISKVSIDARKNEVHFVYSVAIYTNINENVHVNKIKNKDIRYVGDNIYKVKKINYNGKKPVVIGFGPAGMFCGLILAKAGLNPIILEKGAEVNKRVAIVDEFWKTGKLSETTNVQFGEGGAGTFSDGKLTTRIKDPRCHYILKKLIDFGAPKEIAYKSKPHVGTDMLRKVVENLRNEIINLGGEIRFETEVLDFKIKNNKIVYLKTNHEDIETDSVVLAVGHSARDIFRNLYEKDILMEAKPFSVGLRAEHLQENIDNALFKEYAGHKLLPKGEYQLSLRRNNRAVYSFCMCPGGVVVPSSSTEGGVVVNGMSEYLRNGKNANSGIVVSINPDDFTDNPIKGIEFQENLEKKAFIMGGRNYKAPAQTLDNFMKNKSGLNIKNVKPSYEVGVTESNLRDLLPEFVSEMIVDGFNKFETNLKGFSNGDTILTGIESRTSSPIRILRNDNFESVSVNGLYPAGEGPGYAGGIMSAAVDGMKVAEAIINAVKE